MSLNSVTLMGNLVRDPETKKFDGGGSITNFTIATNRSYKNKSGERVDVTAFIECKASGPRGETIAKYFGKGKPIIVVGYLDQQNWLDRETQAKRSKLVVAVNEFSFLPKNDGGGSQAPAPQTNTPSAPPHDDIPF